MALVLNILVLLLEARGLWISISGRKWKILQYYTQLSNLTATASSLLFVLLGATAFVTMFRYLSTCMLIMTMLVTVCILVPMGGDPKKLLWSGNGIYHHILCPIISSASYILFEEHAGLAMIWLPVVLTLVYGLVMLYLNAKEIADGPYPFFRVKNQSVLVTIVWMLALIAFIALISAVVGIVAR